MYQTLIFMSDYDITINDLTFFPKISYESEYQLGWYVIKPFKREIIEKKNFVELVSNVPLSWQHLEDCNRKIFVNLDKFLNFWYLTLEYDSAVAIISFNNLRIQYSSKYLRLRIYLLLWHIYGNVMLNHKHTINVSSTRTIVMIFYGSRHFSRGRYLLIWWEKNSSKVIKF